MASLWEYGVTLIDQNELKRNMRFKLGVITGASFEAEAATAQSRASTLTTHLKAITDANVYATSLTCKDQFVDAGIPASAECSEEAVVLVHTNDTNYPTELAQLRIPAPIDGLFVNDTPNQGVDIADAGLASYVGNFETAVEISDGEHVNPAEGTAGIKSGFWRSVARSLR